jgi:WD40 repeat protein
MSPDGRTLATGRGDNLVRLWDVETLELKAILSGHFGTVQGLDFSPDGQTLASACDSDNTVRLWDLSQLD